MPVLHKNRRILMEGGNVNMRSKYYIGSLGGVVYEVFKSSRRPTYRTHGYLYDAVSGPYRTLEEVDRFMLNLRRKSDLIMRVRYVSDKGRYS